jgi:hypothetical protein
VTTGLQRVKCSDVSEKRTDTDVFSFTSSFQQPPKPIQQPERWKHYFPPALYSEKSDHLITIWCTNPKDVHRLTKSAVKNWKHICGLFLHYCLWSSFNMWKVAHFRFFPVTSPILILTYLCDDNHEITSDHKGRYSCEGYLELAFEGLTKSLIEAQHPSRGTQWQGTTCRNHRGVLSSRAADSETVALTACRDHRAHELCVYLHRPVNGNPRP